jgi:hypothetical protein
MSSASGEAADLLARLTKSGVSDGAWRSKVEDTISAWKAASPLAKDVTFDDFQCFQGGCTFATLHPDMGTLENVSADLRNSDPLRQLNCPGFRSGPIEMPSGQIKAVWILYSKPPAPQL